MSLSHPHTRSLFIFYVTPLSLLPSLCGLFLSKTIYVTSLSIFGSIFFLKANVKVNNCSHSRLIRV